MRTKKQSVSNALFDTDIIQKNDNTKRNKFSTNTIDTSIVDISSKSSSKNSKSVRKVDDKSTKINDKSKSKPTEKSKTRTANRKSTKKSNTTDTEITSKLNQDDQKIKVGRRDRKHNWWPGCDYVWVDGIDHWVAKTAFRNDTNSEPVYTLNNYVQGLDSYWVLRYIPPQQINESITTLEMLNKELKKKFKSWIEVSEYSKLDEYIIEKYKEHISWYHLLATSNKNNRIFTDKFKHKFIDKFKLYDIIK